MGLRIGTNLAAMSAHRALAVTDRQMTGSLEKLSTGLRINRAADDAAGLSISEGLRAQIGGTRVAIRNTQDAISLVQTAEGALGESSALLQRMRELAVRAANEGSLDGDARAAADAEYQAHARMLTDIAYATSFGGTSLLKGYAGTFQVGYGRGDAVQVLITHSRAVDLFGGNAPLYNDLAARTPAEVAADEAAHVAAVGSLITRADAETALGRLDGAIDRVSDERARLGSYQNRFEHVIAGLGVTLENLTASESRIRDTDMAQEMVSLTRAQILSQSGTAMLAKANQAPQEVLRLLQ